MKIAQITPTFPPYRGGMGSVAQEYCTRLARLGHSVEVFTPARSGRHDDPAFVRRLSSPLRTGNAALAPSLLRRLRGFDVLHLHYPFFGGAEPVLIRKAFHPGQSLIVTYHMDASADGVKGALFRLHNAAVLPKLVSRADRILISSLDYFRTSLLATVPGVMERIEEHTFGVDAARFHPGSDPDIAARVGAFPGEPIFLFVGALDSAHRFKGVPVLLEALRRLTDRSWRLVVVGGGPLRRTFGRLANSCRIGDRVHFAGDVSDDELPRYYRAAQIHVLPATRSSEAFGLVSLEAAASGIPTIASALPGVRTVVVDDETGLHVTPGDTHALQRAMRLLLEREDLRTRLGQRARERAIAEFSWDPAIARLEATYGMCAAAPSQYR